MTPTPVAQLFGTVDNGRSVDADFYFFKGRAGVRDYEDRQEIAFFAAPVQLSLPLSGTLDGRPVEVSDFRVSNLDPQARNATSQIVSITLIVRPNMNERS